MKRFLTAFFLAILALLFLLIGFATVIATTTWGQVFVTRQVNNYLAKKIKSPFHIGRIRYHLPDYVALEDVLFITPKGDTLLAGQKMHVDLDMMALLDNRVMINQVDLERIRLKITRTRPDTTFNFQYIVDAFDTGAPPKPADTAAAPLDINLTAMFLKDVRIVYQDDVVGADVNAYVDSLRAGFTETNLNKNRYHLDSVRVEGLTALTRLYKGIDLPEKPGGTTQASVAGDTLDLKLGTWEINKSRWDVRVEEAGFQTKGSIGRLAMTADYLHLDGQRVGIRSLDLTNSDIAARLTKQPKAAPPPKTAPATATPAEEGGWQARLSRLRLADSRIRFDDDNQAPLRTGLDYGHLDLQGLNLAARQIGYSPELIQGQFRGGRFRDKSGFVLQRLDADVKYGDTLTSVTGLLVQTPQTLLRDQLILRYDSIGQLSRPAEARRVGVRVSLRQSRLAVSDLLQLAPFLANTAPFAGNRNAVIRVNTLMRGTLASLSIPTFELDMLSGTRIRASGRLTNVTDVDRLGMDLTIRDATTRLSDIRKLAPKGSLPDSIGIPPGLRLTGRMQGQLNDLNLQSALRTDWGNAGFNGTLTGFVSGRNPSYRGRLTLDNLDAGRFLYQRGTIGRITAEASVRGQGLDVKTMQTVFRLNVREAELNGYRYQRVAAQGRLSNGTLDVESRVDDPNVQIDLNTRVGLQQAYPSVEGRIAIQELNLTQLKLYKDPLSLRGRLEFDFSSTDPAQPVGELRARETVVNLKNKTYPIDSLFVRAGTQGGRKTVEASVPFARVNFDGQFEYTRLYDIFVGEFSRYFELPGLTFNRVNPPYSFNIRMTAQQHPLLKAFVPALTRLDTVRLDAYLDNVRDTTFLANLKTGVIEYDTMQIRSVVARMQAASNQLDLSAAVNGIEASGLELGRTELTGTAAGNQLRFAVVSKDSVGNPRHGLAGRLSVAERAYQLRFNPDGLLTNYRRWVSDSAGFLQYSEQGILANRFSLQSGEQRLTVNSTVQQPNAPLDVRAENIILSDLAKIADQDTTLVGGVLNADVVLRDYMTNLSFTGNIRVDSLKVMNKGVGNLTAKLANTDDRRIRTEMALTGSGNAMTVNGFYNPTNADQALDFDVNLQQLTMQTIEAFSFGQLRYTRGRLTGQVSVDGSVSRPRLDGSIAFDSVSFNVAYINATYRIHQESIRFDEQTVRFQEFDVRDTLNRVLTTNGTVTIRNLPDVAYDLRISAKNFLVLNAARKDNDFVYGLAAITADLGIRGTGSRPTIAGSLRLEDNSRVTMVLPDESSTVNEAREVVTFIDHNDTLALRKYLTVARPDTAIKRIAFQQLSNATVSLSLEANEKSELTIVVDELNGDNLRVRGNARLNVTVNASGEINLLGRYEVTEGEYSLTYQVLKRQFSIQKGSSITWTGDPLRADLDITAIYNTSTTPANLVANESSEQLRTAAKQKLPFNVLLKMQGRLSAPDISFDITMPEQNFVASRAVIDAVNSKLGQLRQDPSQLNKQVFGLLVLGSFIAETSSSSSGGGINTEEIARNSVSKILSDQLERFASSLIRGVDVDFNLLSSSQSAAVNNQVGSRTDLNVGVSKSFLQGRLTVTVGRNFVLENNTGINRNPNEVFDNVSLNYNLTRDGRYMIRGYRRSDYQAVLEGYIIETGVGFVITVDYNLLSELFGKKPADTAQ
ncbi:translocation/assembly module TamB domain-containing protein [Larkinella soli]|uniref:translocation/assembly module TamB domain-containing protein n=1 Tax=Larkinella soli TaxID=1770527 RepID=UPI000FFBA28D|nr:translocation/assembly module TamB domain-containing protein [Larkinella soli]